MKLRPPCEGIFYNGTKVPLEGIEVLSRDVDSLLSAGWSEVEASEHLPESGEGDQ